MKETPSDNLDSLTQRVKELSDMLSVTLREKEEALKKIHRTHGIKPDYLYGTGDVLRWVSPITGLPIVAVKAYVGWKLTNSLANWSFEDLIGLLDQYSTKVTVDEATEWTEL